MKCLTNFTELKKLRDAADWELTFRSQVGDYHRAIRMQKLLTWIDGKIWKFEGVNVLKGEVK